MIEQTLSGDYLKMADVQQTRLDELFAKENVIGVSLGLKTIQNKETNEPSIIVMVRNKVTPDMLRKEDLIPKKFGDYKTDVVEVGEIFAGHGSLAPDVENIVEGELDYDTRSRLRFFEEADRSALDAHEPVTETRRSAATQPVREATPLALRQRIRPAMGGFSVGHYNVTAGTISTSCYDTSAFPGIPQQFYILSNCHVLANSNNARIGDPILQPGPYDGGQYPRDLIGRLSRFVPIRFKTDNYTPINYVDAAIAEVPFHRVNREIYWIGHVKNLHTAPNIGDIVQKTGRSTNYSTGRVIGLNATVDVNYGNGRTARFSRQIITTCMSAAGDSGSLATNLDEQGVGLLFAGSSVVTVMNNLLYVQALLKIRIHEK